MSAPVAEVRPAPHSPRRLLPAVEQIRKVGVTHTLLIAVASLAILMFAVTGALRAVYPYPIDGLEPGALQQVDRVVAGLPLYVAPTLDYVPQLYGPVYFYLAAPLAALSGSSQLALRATSLLASLGSIGLLILLVRTETGSLAAGLVAGALLSGCNQLVAGAMDIGRTEATALFFLLAAVYSLRQSALSTANRRRMAALGGVAMGVAILTKQSAAAVGLAMAVVLLFVRREQLPAYLAALVLTVGLVLGLLVLQTGRWPIFYMWQLPRAHQILPDLMWRMWGDILGRFAPAILVGPLFLVACAVRRERQRLIFYGAFVLAMIGQSWASQATIRGGSNVELPAYAALATLAGLGLHEAIVWIGSGSSLSRLGRGYLYAAAIGQLVVLAYNPRLNVPYRSDMWAGERLSARLAELPGPIFAGAFQGYVRNVPGAVAPDLAAVVELQGEQVRPSTKEGDDWGNQLSDALREGRFTYLIVDPENDGFIVPQLADAYDYVDVGQLFPPGDDYWRWRTHWVPKVEVYARPDLAPRKR